MTKSRDIADSTKTLDVDGGTIKLDGNYPVGTENVALGNTALDSVQSGGNYNVAIGSSAGTAITTGDQITAVGYQAGAAMTTNSQSNFFGYHAGLATTGPGNNFFGTFAGEANTSGINNVAMGNLALRTNVDGDDNVAIGANALRYFEPANGSSYNTAVGSHAGINVTTGIKNTFIGGLVGDATTTAEENTAVGYESMTTNTTGGDNSASGAYSLRQNLTGSNNAAMGYSALEQNTTGGSNTAVGYKALEANTTASNNTAVGYQAGYSNTTGSGSISIGYQAGYTNTTANFNTFIGHKAGYTSTGRYNTFVGSGTITNVSDYGAGQLMTTGEKNTILGGYNGNQGGLDIRTSSNNIVLSDGDGNPRIITHSNGNTSFGTTVNHAVVGVGTTVGNWGIVVRDNANNTALVRFETTSGGVGSITHNGSATAYNTSSDHRLKENVDYTWDATTRLKQLKPARFNFIADPDTTVDGFLAHEAQAFVPEAVTGTHNEVDDDGVAVMQGIDQSKLVPLLVKTIQELEARITALEA